MMNKKGFEHVEYIMVVSMLLIFLAPIVYYANKEVESEKSSIISQNFISTIASAVKTIHRTEEGSIVFIPITFPNRMKEIRLNNSEIFIRVRMGNVSQSSGEFLPGIQLTGSLDTRSGTRNIKIEKINESHVKISELK